MADAVTEDRGPQIRAVTYSMLVLATVAVALRFWARFVALKAGFWWDDWFSLAALLSFRLGELWIIHLLSLDWLGKTYQSGPSADSQVALVLFVENFVYNTGLFLVKLSVLLFYIRVFRSIRIYRIEFWITGAILVGWCLAINFLALFTCVPVQKAWITTTPGHCLNTEHTFPGAAISNIIADLIVLLLPIPMLWQLHIETLRKLGLVGVFAAGYCVIILSVLRLASVVDLGDKLQKDISWNLAYPQMLVICEMPVALLSSCLPSIFNLVKHGMRRSSPIFFNRMNASKLVSGPAGSHIGPIGNPIDERRKNGFVQLQSGKQNTGVSEERLFDNMDGTEHYTTAFPTKHGRDEEVVMGIPLRQIHVRDDVQINTQRS